MTETLADPVLAWRETMFRALDLAPELAEVCAMLAVDWHDLADLLDDGCDPAIALRILA